MGNRTASNWLVLWLRIGKYWNSPKLDLPFCGTGVRKVPSDHGWLSRLATTANVHEMAPCCRPSGAAGVCGSQLILAHKSRFWNILESGELVVKPLVAWNQPWWEYLYHRNGQIWPIGGGGLFWSSSSSSLKLCDYDQINWTLSVSYS